MEKKVVYFPLIFIFIIGFFINGVENLNSENKNTLVNSLNPDMANNNNENKQIKIIIHDVQPERKTMELLRFMQENKISAYLLVIPTRLDPELIELLKNYPETIIIQHGVYHNISLSCKIDKRESEFYGLNYIETSQKLFFGKQLLDNSGLSPVGYYAPCWQQTEIEHHVIKKIYGENDFTNIPGFNIHPMALENDYTFELIKNKIIKIDKENKKASIN